MSTGTADVADTTGADVTTAPPEGPVGTSGPGHRVWLPVLVSVLGAYEVVLAVSAGVGIAVLGTVSGLAVMAAPWVARRWARTGAALLVVGTVPVAVVTWWSLVVPWVALLALAVGLPVILGMRRHPR